MPTPRQPSLSAQTRLILWVGPKHSGKTTAAQRLLDRVRTEGFRPAGFLSLSIYDHDQLTGFDLHDIGTDGRMPLARRTSQPGQKVGAFTLLPNALDLGHQALALSAVANADLVIVDEFGPLELNAQGWRQSVDTLIDACPALVLLVVRRGILHQVHTLYAHAHPADLNAQDPHAADQVLCLLRTRASLQNST